MNAGHLVPAVVVTGASSGVGREFARLAIEDGVALVLVGRSEPALAELVQELSARRAAKRSRDASDSRLDGVERAFVTKDACGADCSSGAL